MSEVIDIPEWQQTPAQGFFNETQLAQLNRLMDRLLPEDPARQMPGAVRAGAAEFISLLLNKTGATYYEIPDWRAQYPKWLDALEQWSQGVHGTSLADLDDAKVDTLISALEQGTLTGSSLAAPQQPAVFKTIWRHMLQGCFGDPRWGGNKGKIMWRAIGYLQTPETAGQIENDRLPFIPL
jgi:gluconate 2-dehydrogenase gamma chain